MNIEVEYDNSSTHLSSCSGRAQHSELSRGDVCRPRCPWHPRQIQNSCRDSSTLHMLWWPWKHQGNLATSPNTRPIHSPENWFLLGSRHFLLGSEWSHNIWEEWHCYESLRDRTWQGGSHDRGPKVLWTPLRILWERWVYRRQCRDDGIAISFWDTHRSRARCTACSSVLKSWCTNACNPAAFMGFLLDIELYSSGSMKEGVSLRKATWRTTSTHLRKCC